MYVYQYRVYQDLWDCRAQGLDHFGIQSLHENDVLEHQKFC